MRATSLAIDLWTSLASQKFLPNKLRLSMLRRAGAILGDVTVGPGATFLGGVNVTIGDLSFVNWGCLFDTPGHITIGRNTGVGPRVSFYTATHHLGPSTGRIGALYTAPIKVGDGCWIGANTTILPGVTIGNGCVIAAGSVVINDCEPDTLYAGVPAKAVRSLGP
jgi:maltose O-acetyltransferase